MTRALILAVVILLAAVAVLLAENRATRVTAQADRAALDRAQAALSVAAEAAEVHRAHIKRQTAEAEEWRVLIDDLTSQEEADAPLSDYLRHAAGRVLAR